MSNTGFFSHVLTLVRLVPTAAALGCALAACSPKYDWREVHGSDAPYVAAFPAKPDTFSRRIDLHGIHVDMTMRGAQIDGNSFAIGSAELADRAQAGAALAAMKTALVKNISGSIVRETSTISDNMALSSIDIEAKGSAKQGGATQALRLTARFVAQDRRIYQIVVLGKDGGLPKDAVETFITSFRLNP